VEGKEHMRCKIKKSIYGLKQVSRQWYLKFDEVIKKFGFIENQVDNCIYFKIKESICIILVLYVDDILLACSDKNLLHETKGFLSSNFDMKDLDDASYILGIEIHQDGTKSVLGLSQRAYIEKMLKRYNMHNCSSQPAPVVKGDKLGTFQEPRNLLEINQIKSIPYALAVRSIMYAQVCTRPDLAFVTGLLDRFQSNLGFKHWQSTKKALHYLQETKHYMLTYKRTNNLEIIGYTNANFAGCADSQTSTSGYVFTLVSGAISWRSCKQTITTSSTMYAKFIACYEAVGQAVWLKNFIPVLRVVDNISMPLTLYYDNKTVVFFSHNNKSSGVAKHIGLKYLVVRERVHDHTINLKHISTKKMLVDPLTKGLPPNIFQKHAVDMGLLESI
jgi:hypothetical protein